MANPAVPTIDIMNKGRFLTNPQQISLTTASNSNVSALTMGEYTAYANCAWYVLQGGTATDASIYLQAYEKLNFFSSGESEDNWFHGRAVTGTGTGWVVKKS